MVLAFVESSTKFTNLVCSKLTPSGGRQSMLSIIGLVTFEESEGKMSSNFGQGFAKVSSVSFASSPWSP